MKKIVHGLIMLTLFIWSSAVSADMPDRAKETLRSLPGVTVIIEPQ